jgi:LPS sulfotransferase NodH
LFEPESDCPPYDGERIYYVICAPPRTGSNLLCNLMAGSGVMGVPDEYFHPRGGWKIMAERLGLSRDGKVDMAAYINGLESLRTTPNGVFGVKIQYWMMPPLIKNRVISTFFPGARFIFLTRRDHVAQGVSFDMASQTGKWSSQRPPSNRWMQPLSGSQPNTQYSPEEPVYDRKRIMEAINFVLREQTSWEAFFAINDIRPYRAEYERLIEDTHAVCEEVCDHIGVTTDHQFTLDRAPIKRQRSDLNQQWMRRIKKSAGY